MNALRPTQGWLKQTREIKAGHILRKAAEVLRIRQLALRKSVDHLTRYSVSQGALAGQLAVMTHIVTTNRALFLNESNGHFSYCFVGDCNRSTYELSNNRLRAF